MRARIEDVTFSVEYSSRRTLDLTNPGTHMRANRLKLTIVGILAAAHAGLASAAPPLEDAAYEATRLCNAADAISLEACGNSTVASPAHSSARKALIRMYNERTAFMRKCEERDRLSDCQHMAESLMTSGISRAGNEYWKAKGLK